MKKIRAHLGLTQTDMSRLIGSNKTTANLYEKGSRLLNAKELRMLTGIEILMTHAPATQRHEKINLNEQKDLTTMLRKLAYEKKLATLKCETLRMKLAKLEEMHSCNQNLWRLLQAMQTDSRGAFTNPYAGVLELRCLEKLKSCGLHQQVLIRHQIAILESEIASAQQLIEEIEGYGMPIGD